MQLVISQKHQQKKTTHKSSGASTETDYYVVHFRPAYMFGSVMPTLLGTAGLLLYTSFKQVQIIFHFSAEELIQTSLAFWAQRCMMAVVESRCDLT